MATWIFQGSKEYFDIDSYVKENDDIDWQLNQHTKEVKVGDIVFIFRAKAMSKYPAGIIARAEVCSPPVKTNEAQKLSKYSRGAKSQGDKLRVGLKIRERVPTEKACLSREELLKDQSLAVMRIFTAPNGTNFPVSTAQEIIIQEKWFSLISSWSVQKLIRDFVTNSLLIAEKSEDASLRQPVISGQKYRDLEIKVSYGQGNFAKTTWVAFLGYEQQVQKGIYPVILFSTAERRLEVCFGVSETERPDFIWHQTDTSNYMNSRTSRYPASIVRAEFDVADIKDLEASLHSVISNLDSVIDVFHNSFRNRHFNVLPNNIPTAYSVEDINKDGCFVPMEQILNIMDILKRKKNIVLQGPPGTGKTWLAKKIAQALIGSTEKSLLKIIQFHPTISYEEFVRGWRPQSDLKLGIVDGVFLNLIDLATRHPDSNVVLVIEEINRGNPAQIFGELLTLLEDSKRSEDSALEICYPDKNGQKTSIFIPNNLFIIGTMNVGDRSIAPLDLALRRRFSFFDLEPLLNDVWLNWIAEKRGVEVAFGKKVQSRINDLNDYISNHRALGRQFRIGHSFVTPTKGIAEDGFRQWFGQVVQFDIGPLLDEYFFDSPRVADELKQKLLEGI